MQGYSLYRYTFDKMLVETAPTELDVRDKSTTRAYGDAWIGEVRSVALRVPSIVAPESFNMLLNPDHPKFQKVRREPLGPFGFEERIAALVERAQG